MGNSQTSKAAASQPPPRARLSGGGSQSDGDVRVIIQTPSGTSLSVDVAKGACAKDLKLLYRDVAEVPCWQQQLFVSGNEDQLPDSAPLHECDIENGSAVFVLVDKAFLGKLQGRFEGTWSGEGHGYTVSILPNELILTPYTKRLPNCNCCARPTTQGGIMCHNDVCGFNQCQKYENYERCTRPIGANGTPGRFLNCPFHEPNNPDEPLDCLHRSPPQEESREESRMNVELQFKWVLSLAPVRGALFTQIGNQATEFCRGTFDARTGELHVAGYAFPAPSHLYASLPPSSYFTHLPPHSHPSLPPFAGTNWGARARTLLSLWMSTDSCCRRTRRSSQGRRGQTVGTGAG